MQDKLYEMLMNKDEITWQTIIYDLVKTGEMDPWDIDISILAQRYLETIKKLQEHNFFLSGKILLASAILLKIKSEKLLTEGIAALDSQLFPSDELEEMDAFGNKRIILDENPRLTIKTPQARKKKVSINDLVFALEKALEVNQRRVLRRQALERIPDNLKIPAKPINIEELISSVFNRIKSWFANQEKLTFTEFVNSDNREAKLATFVPLLHLCTQSKIDLLQEKPFEEIEITLMNTQNNNQNI